MNVRELTDYQKYELLLAILNKSPLGTDTPLGHLVIDYMPSWGEFSSLVASAREGQKSMGTRWGCHECNDLQEYITGINTVTHRKVDYDDPDEPDFTCNCSYCQIVLGTNCDCGRCEISNSNTLVYKDYITGLRLTDKQIENTLSAKPKVAEIDTNKRELLDTFWEDFGGR